MLPPCACAPCAAADADRTRNGQRVHAAALHIDPNPAPPRGTRLLRQSHDLDRRGRAAQTLTVKLTARVSVDPLVDLDALATPDGKRRAKRVRHQRLGPRRLRISYLRAAGLARSRNPRLRTRSFPPGRPILDGAIELMRRLKSDNFVYEIGATTVTTTPPMSFALRRGVCQDFAHIMISGLRGLGLPAGYVSGYLRTALRTDARACKAPTRCMPGCWYGADGRPAGSGLILQMRYSPPTSNRARAGPRLYGRGADGRRRRRLGRAAHRSGRQRHAGGKLGIRNGCLIDFHGRKRRGL